MDKNLSKFLSLVLRHQPETIGITLDQQGWADVDELIAKMQRKGKRINHDILERIVAESDKKRFTLSPDGLKIRAAQGHSVKVDLGLEPSTPPATLYHGTATHVLDAILQEGLKPGKRQKVHLSLDRQTATKVGQRHGKVVILLVDSGQMHKDGHLFWQAENGVWLTDHVPCRYLEKIS